MGRHGLWWLALGAAALLLMVASGIAVLRRNAARPAPSPAAPAVTADAGLPTPQAEAIKRDACGVPETLSLSAARKGAPVLLWAVAPVRLYLDDKAAFSPPEQPLRLTGEHVLRAEARGEETLTTRFRVEDGTPVLFHAQLDEGLGITLVRIGGSCASCEFKDVDVTLEVQPSSEPTFSLLQAAASHLRADRWRLALPRLQRVPQKDRTKIPFLRLASNIHQATADPDGALKHARAIPASRSNDLAMLLDAWERLRRAEDRNTPEGLLSRWNLLTERFGAAASKFADDVPGPLSSATRRLEQLSNAFEQQLEKKDARAQRATVEAAEDTVLQLVRELRATRPSDCAFQKDVVATVFP